MHVGKIVKAILLLGAGVMGMLCCGRVLAQSRRGQHSHSPAAEGR